MVYWHWLILGGVFLIAEVASFTTFFLFFAISAFIMATITALFPEIILTWQLFIAAILTVLSCICFYIVYKKRRVHSAANDVNDRLKQYIGMTVTLTEDAQNGISKAKVGDTLWRVEITGGLKGDQVKICSYYSTTFIAEKVPSK
jgi:inner membrane protein